MASMSDAEKLASVTAHRDGLIAEVRDLQRAKKSLGRQNEQLKRDLAAACGERDAAVLENAALRRRRAAAAGGGAAAAAGPGSSDAARNARAAAAAAAVADNKPPRPAFAPPPTGAFGLAKRADRPAAPRPASGLAALARMPLPAGAARAGGPEAKKPRPAKAGAAAMRLIDGLYLTSVWNGDLAADYAAALVDDVWRGAAPPTAALSGSLELRAWKSLQPRAVADAWDAGRDFLGHPFDDASDAPRRSPDRRRPAREPNLAERSMREARAGAESQPYFEIPST